MSDKKALSALLLAGVAYQIYVALYQRGRAAAVVVPNAPPEPPQRDAAPLALSIADTLVSLFGLGGDGPRPGGGESAAPDWVKYLPPSPVTGAIGLPPVREIAEAVVDRSQPRGIRNHNPGNIRHGAQWQGMRAEQTDAEFVQFVSPEMGVRAMGKVLGTYLRAYYLDTPRGIIGRWAPPVENNTEAYVSAVSHAAGLSPDGVIETADQWVRLVEAMIHHENGRQPYQRQTIVNGLRLSGLI